MASARPTVVLIGTLDTKGDEYGWAQKWLRSEGADVILIDFGVLANPTVVPDICAADVAEKGGVPLEELQVAREGSDTRARGLAVMTDGLARLLGELHRDRRLHAVMGMGGSGGSSVISAAMRSLPVGVPKLLVSTMASGDVGTYVRESDLTIMHSVSDILGINRLSSEVIGNACGAALGMAHAYKGRLSSPPPETETVGITMFGVTTPCVRRVTELLNETGVEVVVFHAVGSGGRAMEQLVTHGQLDGVIDVTTSELVDAEYGGKFPAGPDRLRASVDAGIPYVVVPGAMEVLNFASVDTIPERFSPPKREPIVHNTSVCAVRTNKEEASHLGSLMAERLRGGGDHVVVVIPTQGFSNYSKRPDGPWIDYEADQSFIAALKENLDSDIQVIEVDANINDREFAEAVAHTYLQLRRRIADRRRRA